MSGLGFRGGMGGAPAWNQSLGLGLGSRGAA